MPTQAAIDVSMPALPAPSLPKADREILAFRKLLPHLLLQYAGEYVAIHDEQVIDHARSDIDLIQRVHARIGYVPIYVGLVTRELPIIRVPHYREFSATAK